MNCLLLSISLLFSVLPFQDEVVYVEFTNKTTFDELVQIRTQLAEKNITLDYLLIQYEENKLKALSIAVDCHDGHSGSGKSLDLSAKDKISITRDYRPGAREAFYVEVMNAD